MKKVMLLALVLGFTLGNVATAAQADDNKVTKGAKKIGRGIMWGPKKVGQGMSAGWKKITGKK